MEIREIPKETIARWERKRKREALVEKIRNNPYIMVPAFACFVVGGFFTLCRFMWIMEAIHPGIWR